MIEVIFGVSLFLIALIAFTLIINLTSDCYATTIAITTSSCIVTIIVLIAILVMSNNIMREPTYKSVISKKAKYNEVLYIDNNDTIKLYKVVKINEDTIK